MCSINPRGRVYLRARMRLISSLHFPLSRVINPLAFTLLIYHAQLTSSMPSAIVRSQRQHIVDPLRRRPLPRGILTRINFSRHQRPIYGENAGNRLKQAEAAICRDGFGRAAAITPVTSCTRSASCLERDATAGNSIRGQYLGAHLTCRRSLGMMEPRSNRVRRR
jgi:hypothetical protein